MNEAALALAARRRPALVIFDNDGTLVDSEPLGHRAMASVLGEVGVEVDPASLEVEFRGWELARELAVLSRRHGTTLGDEVVTRYRRRLVEIFDEALQPMPGAGDAVAAAKDAGCAIAVASGGPMAKITQALSLTGLAAVFGDAIYSSYEVGSFKPDPGLFLHVAQRHGIAPGRCLVVEDSAVGVEAALRADMTVALIGREAAASAALPAEAGRVLRLPDLHALARWLAATTPT